jgi:hypothetical protein
VAHEQVDRQRLQTEHERLQAELDHRGQELEYYEGVARLSERDRRALQSDTERLNRLLATAEAARQKREADLRQLASETERFRLELDNVRGVAHQKEAECRHLCAEVERLIAAHAAECGHLRGEIGRLAAVHTALTQGTGARTLGFGLRIARRMHWTVSCLRRLTGSRALQRGVPVPQGVPAAPPAPNASKQGGSFMTGIKRWIKDGLRPFVRVAKRVCRPVAQRWRGFMLAPLTPYLEAVPRLCVLTDRHGELLSQLKDWQCTLEGRLQHTTQAVAHLQNQLERGLAVVQAQQGQMQNQLERGLAVVQAQQGQIVSDLHGQQGVMHEAERMLLAMLKSAQLIEPQREATEAAPRLYRQVDDTVSA